MNHISFFPTKSHILMIFVYFIKTNGQTFMLWKHNGSRFFGSICDFRLEGFARKQQSMDVGHGHPKASRKDSIFPMGRF